MEKAKMKRNKQMLSDYSFLIDIGGFTYEDADYTARVAETEFYSKNVPGQLELNDDEFNFLIKKSQDMINVIYYKNNPVGRSFIISSNKNEMKDFLYGKIPDENKVFR